MPRASMYTRCIETGGWFGSDEAEEGFCCRHRRPEDVSGRISILWQVSHGVLCAEVGMHESLKALSARWRGGGPNRCEWVAWLARINRQLLR